jgi:hypothetical protein
MAEERSGTAKAGRPVISLAHGGLGNRTKKGDPKAETGGSVLKKKCRKPLKTLDFSPSLWYN